MSLSSRLSVCMLLSPQLATLTYAAPYLISIQAVSYQVNAMRPLAAPVPAVSSLLDRMPSAATMVASWPDTLMPDTITHDVKPDFLVFKDDMWHSTPSLTADLLDGEISDAKLTTRETDGDVEWEVEAPITFSYRVRESRDVLDPASDALLFGHLTDARDLERAKSRKLKRVVVVDSAVYEHFGERIEAYFRAHEVETRMMVLPTTEENKNMDLVLKIAETIHDLGLDRRLDPVIAIGGGVCMDIVGFAASIYRRRTPYIRVPTTLMGYVDASIGAKSGINFSGKKNKLGAYLPPALAILDRSFLATLDQRQLSNGASEIMKMALVKDPELFHLLEKHGPELISGKFQAVESAIAPGGDASSRVLFLAIQTMLEELAPNLWEDSLKRLVDFGHVFSMELEMNCLHDEKLFHGEAVGIDMAYSAVLACVRGQIDESYRNRILKTMVGLQIPIAHPRFDADMVDDAIYERIKFSQGQKIPLPTDVGIARLFNDITMEEMQAALEAWPAAVEAAYD